MVTVRQSHSAEYHPGGTQSWLSALGLPEAKISALLDAELWLHQQNLTDQEPEVQTGWEMVEILADLRMDKDALTAALLFPLVDAKLIELEQVETQFCSAVLAMLNAVRQMEAIRSIPVGPNQSSNPQQADNLRRMLLAMVEDVRAVVLKLAAQICYLRSVKNADEETRVLAAKETNAIFGPLANRLGIGQIKWELEDLAFRYLHPQTYKQIASLLEEKRLDREQYMQDFVASVRQKMQDAAISVEVYGRPKHIFSIWKKMQKKQLAFDQLYDIRAVRIVTTKVQDCYAALGIVHTSWRHLPKEFDDYIATPKQNGYQSIHTVVLGPAGRPVEIQIRTHQMHDDAELGVAAHWRYKEGAGHAGKEGQLDEKIGWLRKLLAWQEELVDGSDLAEELKNQVTEDRVYVFTPKGDIVDLPVGSTPLDFAYYVHSNVGHRCIGAKISGRIVPFTYQLKTGDQIEILTGREPNPSRDWLNPNSGYLKSSRARSKVQYWFRLQDRDKNIAAGKELLDTELNRLNLSIDNIPKVLARFNVNSMEEILAGIGGGEIKVTQVVHYIQSQSGKLQQPEIDPRLISKPISNQPKSHVVVQGVGNLLTHMAGCCQPLPGDAIVGYITQGRGIAVHRDDCEQFKVLQEAHRERVVEATWGDKYASGYEVTIRIVAHDRNGLLRDITSILANEKANVLRMSSNSDISQQTATIIMTMELYNLDSLNKLLTKVSQIDDVIEAKRFH
ncbi:MULTISPECIES: GTP diphosphokinase [Rheinheimera]|jgi:GTP pyrophosphokinase|uniref:GTP pyrophosphokinase n=2 Tax=Rheinheimera TaxID=67575 RepID=A0A5C8LP99_9GAMM|nr:MULTISPECIES: GTP diphosphokinase [Rheinheimera]KOO59419.1 (p)ppGpp synthetase [Rheinheimera sp. KL1]TXK79191.1 GTP diphosphokinase [Rheinheimera tangshanensis]GGM68055.1 GTP diphosphokinase [Rheinheimera tangshanensis]